jgi:nitrogen fixation protein FixH
MFKLWHMVALVVIVFACIYASNNVPFISNVVK